MKLSNETLNALMNVSDVNNEIKISSGNVIQNARQDGTVFIRTVISEDFEDCVIGDLKQFCKIFKLKGMSAADLEFDSQGRYATIKGDDIVFNYKFTEQIFWRDTIEGFYEATKDEDYIAKLRIEPEELSEFLNASSAMQCKRMVFKIEDHKVYLVGRGVNVDSNTHTRYMCDTPAEDGEYVLNIDNIRFLPLTYDVYVKQKMICFESVDDEYEMYYVIANCFDEE